MPALSFDDLVPAQGAGAQAKTFDPAAGISIVSPGKSASPQQPSANVVTFDDLLPKAAAEPEPSSITKLTTDFLNQGSAAGQRTTPVISAQAPNLISDNVYQNDAGEMQYKDPATGQIVTTDQNKQVILRDPADNKLKVYARTEDTNEGLLSSLGRLIGTGMGSSAPETTAVSVAARPPSTPTIDALKGAASASYESPEVASLTVKPQAVTDSVTGIVRDLNAQGIDEILAPKTFGILSKAQTAPAGSFATADNLLSLRRTLGKAALSIDPTERMAAKSAMSGIDAFLEKVPQSGVLSGDPAAASSAIKDGNANYSAAKHAELIDQKTVRAELRAAAANSGQNVANTIRQRMADILLNPKERRGFSTSELALMNKIVRGTPTQNILRGAGNLLGGGGGLGAVVSAGAGAMATGGPGAIAPVVGFALKKLGNAMTLRQVEQLSEAVRNRSPLGQAVQNSAADWQKAHDALVKAPSASKFSAFAIASRNLSNNLASIGVNVAPVQIMRSVQGPTDAKADSENK